MSIRFELNSTLGEIREVLNIPEPIIAANLVSDITSNLEEAEIIISKTISYLKLYTTHQKYHLHINGNQWCIRCENIATSSQTIYRKFTTEQFNRCLAKVEDLWNMPIIEITHGLVDYK